MQIEVKDEKAESFNRSFFNNHLIISVSIFCDYNIFL